MIMRNNSSDKGNLHQPGKAILVIESDAGFRLSLMRLLQKTGFKVCSVENFEQVQTLVKKANFRLIIFGLNNPDENEASQLERMLSCCHNASLLILSSYNWFEIPLNFEKFINIHTLVKPVKKEDIVNQIQKIFSGSTYSL